MTFVNSQMHIHIRIFAHWYETPNVTKRFFKLHKLENVAIANALQREAARRRAVPIHFNFVTRAKIEVAQPIRCRLRAFY